MDNSVSIHYKNLKRLAIKLFKVLEGIYSDIMKDVLPLYTFSNYNNRKISNFYSRSLNSIYNGTDSLSHLAQKVWELVSNNIKTLGSLPEFKNAIRLWKQIRYSCRIFKT